MTTLWITYNFLSPSGITKAFDLRSNTLAPFTNTSATIIRVPLGEGYTATLGNDVTGGYNEILVNGERIVRTARFSSFKGSKEDAMNGGAVMNNPQYVTTEYVTIEDGGKPSFTGTPLTIKTSTSAWATCKNRPSTT